MKTTTKNRLLCFYATMSAFLSLSGGQVLWVQLPEQINSLDLYRRALHEKISIAPGPIFSAKRKFQNFIRLNCGQPWSQAIESELGAGTAVTVDFPLAEQKSMARAQT